MPELVQPTKKNDRYVFQSKGNPIITHHYTSDPAALVINDTLWMYTGHDFEGGQRDYVMRDWLVYSTTDMKTWTEYPVPLKVVDFEWATSKSAFRSEERRGGKAWMWWV